MRKSNGAVCTRRAMKSKRVLEIENEALRGILNEIGEMTAVCPKRDDMADLIGAVSALTEEEIIEMRIKRVAWEKEKEKRPGAATLDGRKENSYTGKYTRDVGTWQDEK